ncbi:MAG: hypothetical protein B6D68_00860, partial [spirochete symbiont of Stewartia floridana]
MIVNPVAGKRLGRQIADEAVIRLKASGIPVKTFYSSNPGETLSIAQSLNQKDWAGVIAVGGDGTLFEVLNGLHTGDAGITIPVGQIPSGSGNSYLRDLAIFSIDDAVKSIIANSHRQVDLGFFTCDTGNFRFINLLGAGFVSNVARRAVKYKVFGPKSYVFGVIEEVLCLNPISIRLMVDDDIIERNALFVEICNSRYTGGDMLMAPSARIDDGLLDVIVMNAASRLRALQLLPKIFSGAHVHAPEIEVFSGRRIKLESEHPMALTPDGEIFGHTPLEASIEKK